MHERFWEIHDRFWKIIEEESQDEETWWWLSFADSQRPKGEQFLGVAIVRGRGLATAVLRSHMLGINPGGEVKGVDLAEFPVENLPAPAWRERLLTKADLESAGIPLKRGSEA